MDLPIPLPFICYKHATVTAKGLRVKHLAGLDFTGGAYWFRTSGLLNVSHVQGIFGIAHIA